MYIYQNSSWPNFTWNKDNLLSIVSDVRNLQGKLVGKMESLGFDLRNEAALETLTLDIVKSTEIEGEFLNTEQVRSSIARHLGFDIPRIIQSERNVDGVVELMIDATQNFDHQLTAERLFSWHSALFPTGRSGIHKIIVGGWRNDSSGPMRVVSGPMGKEIVHFQAPDASVVAKEMDNFIDWFNNSKVEPLLKAGIAHLWFVTIHPFEDGNGRIARTISEMLLARADGSRQRFYSMSARIQLERKEYYNILEETQKGDLDISNWLIWFSNCLLKSLTSADTILSKVLNKAYFWKKHSTLIFNKRQQTMLNLLMENFEGKLTTTKWAKITRCSQDTALRDIQDLINKGVLQKELSGGRSTSYGLIFSNQ